MDDLVISRVFDAPKDLVWKVWTDPSHLANWWGPAGFTMKVTNLDLKTGGLFHYAMTPPGSTQAMWGKFVYDEVAPTDHLVFRNSFSDEKGGTVRHPMSATWPLEVRNTLTLTEEKGRTTVTLRGRPFNATPEEEKTFDAAKAGINQGFKGTFDQLENYLVESIDADRSIVYKRTFDAPRALVWKAWTTPSSIAAWWGPAGFGNTIYTMDVKVGGTWSYMMHGPDGTDYPNEIRYLTVEEPSQLIYDHGSPGQPDQFRTTVRFSEKGTQTEMLYKMLFPTAAAKQAVVEKFGAVEGLKQNMDRFVDWLKKTGLVLTRVFEAPRALVWKAWTDPVQLKKFWGAGVHSANVPSEKLVDTDAVTVTFVDLGPKKTLLTVHQDKLPEEWKDRTLSGWSTSLDKLAAALA